jgi:hypothetical protein
MFSVALSLGSPPPVVDRHRVLRGARTFLSLHYCKQRPSDRLAWDDMGHAAASVKARARRWTSAVNRRTAAEASLRRAARLSGAVS